MSGGDEFWTKPAESRPVKDAPVKQGHVREVTDTPDDLVLFPARLPNPCTIPPRPWLYGTQLLRGFVTVLVAAGGTGKSAYAMAVALALSSGRKLLGEHVFSRVNTAILNLEDPMEELDRRLAALVMRHGITPEEIEGRMFLHSGESRKIVMAAVAADGFSIWHPDEAALIKEITAHQIGLLVVDPYAESHSLEENSNPQMVLAAAAWRRIARATGCAILLVHHVRKGAAIDIDAARGAKALTDSARVGLLLATMTEEDADMLSVPPEERFGYVRLDDAKANMAARAGRARWFHLEQVDLENGTDAYPNGDKVAAIVAWQPTSALAAQPPSDLNAALDRIAAGPAPDTLYSATRQGNSKRWVGLVLIDVLGVTDKQASGIIHEWLKSGLLSKSSYLDAAEGKHRTGVRVDHAKRPTV